MKKIIYLFIFLSSIILWHACKQEEENLPGTIYGVVTDKATGEPVKSAGVELSPVGLKTITGTEGQFEFTELVPGNYTLLVTKTGYADYASNTIEVKPGQTAQSDIQMVLLPPALKVVDDNRKEISELDFGEAESDVARSFNIFNDGEETLNFQITKTAVWIDSISKTEGSVSAGNIQPIVVFIDRDKLYEKENATTIHITSNSGSKQIKVIATNNRTEMSLNILETTDITASSAVFNAEIVNSGNPKYTERGFVYHTSPMPTKEQTIALLTAPVTEETKFSVKADGLELDQTYYVRAYATNMLGTVYSSNQISFIANATLPTVSTQQVTQIDIASGTATFNGTIVTEGDPVYSERGFVYGTVPNPTIDGNKKIVSGRGTGAYSANITELAEGYTYYVRAYATNEQGTAYGVDVSFSFIATMPTVVTSPVSNIKIGNGTVTFNGKVETLGDLGYTERGFVYNTTHNPTIDDTKLVASGSGLGAYSLNASGIQEGAIYYVRAYLQNSKGVVYGDEVAFDFNAIMPTLSTKEVTNKNIANGMATFNGIIETVGDPMYTERGFVYGIMHNPTLTDGSKLVVPGLGTGPYMANVTGLSEGNLYYIRAYANTPKGCVYGEEVALNFTATMPKVSTSAVTNINIGAGTATFNAKVDSLGDLGYIERGFVYNTAHNPTIDDTKLVASGSGLGIYSLNVSDIQEGDVYYVRAYLQNSKGVVYGEEVSFDFNGVMPAVKTQAVTDKIIASGVATLNGTIVSIGEPSYTERGFVYGITPNPTKDDATIKIVSGTGTGSYSISVSNLNMGSVYHVRAYAESVKGIVYGEDVSFDFKPVAPAFSSSGNRCSEKNLVLGSAVFDANIMYQGDPAYIERGFVYSTMNNPDINSGIKIVVPGMGTGMFQASVSGLQQQSVYYVRAYLKTNSQIVYSEQFEVDFRFTAPKIVIGLGAQQGTKIIINCMITEVGTPKYNTLGICYGESPNPTRENNIVSSESSVGNPVTTSSPVQLNISNSIFPGNTYYIRMFLISESGVVYSNELSVTTTEFFVDGNLCVQWQDIGQMTYEAAEDACAASRVGGYNDWRLPTEAELAIIENKQLIIGGFNGQDRNVSARYSDGDLLSSGLSSGTIYWSTTIGNNSATRKVVQVDDDGDSGSIYISPLNNNFKVRAVRTMY